jgi:uncharacterized protein (TIGR03032 family)
VRRLFGSRLAARASGGAAGAPAAAHRPRPYGGSRDLPGRGRRGSSASPARTHGSRQAAPPPRARSSYTERLPRLLDQLGIALVASWDAHRVVVLRADGTTVNTHFRAFPEPAGLAVAPRGLAIAGRRSIWEYRDVPEMAPRIPPAGRHDACFLPRTCHLTGELGARAIAYAGDELWLASTRFSCLATVDTEHGFVPRWRPRFVTALADQDRCHLSGLAVVDGRVRYVTAFGESDQPRGWFERRAVGGCVVDVESGEIVARGISLPSAPRWYSGRLWFLEAGHGVLATADLATGRTSPFCGCPARRALAFAGPYAFVSVGRPAAPLRRPAARRADPRAGEWHLGRELA